MISKYLLAVPALVLSLAAVAAPAARLRPRTATLACDINAGPVDATSSRFCTADSGPSRPTIISSSTARPRPYPDQTLGECRRRLVYARVGTRRMPRPTRAALIIEPC
jgi:hypothetical protein